jgi:hypothetical protein
MVKFLLTFLILLFICGQSSKYRVKILGKVIIHQVLSPKFIKFILIQKIEGWVGKGWAPSVRPKSEYHLVLITRLNGRRGLIEL